MTRIDTTDLSFDEFDELVNPKPEDNDFDRIVEAAIERRGFLGGVLAFGSFAALGGTLTVTKAKASTSRFAFDQITTSIADDVVVPAGYKVDVMVRWGDPLWSDGAEF
ncbi:MAG: transcriptional initiation protein Tat, partial [Pseudomonadota bacterium]